MCIDKSELQGVVDEIRQMEAMRSEIDDRLEDLKIQVKEFMKETNQDKYIGSDFNISYIDVTRKTLDRKALERELGSDIKEFEKISTYKKLSIR